MHKTGACSLVVPVEATLNASLPTIPDTVKTHKPFSRETVTISGRILQWTTGVGYQDWANHPISFLGRGARAQFATKTT
jgi:hypothetical protein